MITRNIRKLLVGGNLSTEDENQALDALAKLDPGSLRELCTLLANQRRRLQKDLEKTSSKSAEAEALLEKLMTPPLHPARVLRTVLDGKVDVVADGRRVIVAMLPQLAPESLAPGDEVFLNADTTAVVARSDEQERMGLVGTVSETADGKVLVRGVGDEEMVAMATPDLAGSLRPGNRVIYLRDFPCIIGSLPERTQSRYILQHPPAVTFDDIGGLDDLIAQLRGDLDLHLIHRERVSKYRLKLLRGFVLVGPPGVGKTLIAAATANYLHGLGVETCFLDVKPGSLRGSYYGQTEARIRELFAVAKASPGLVVMFFDELDHFGSRGVGLGQEIDDRVLGALLSEMNGLGSADNVLCIGATNRLDRCDPALVRDGRMGDQIYRIPRPRREATRQILERYLQPDLPYANGGAGELIDSAASYLHAPEGGVGTIATATLQSGEQVEIHGSHVLSGALLASAAERAKRLAAQRHLEGSDGITTGDVLSALDEAIGAEADKISVPHVARQLLQIPGADEIALVALAPERRRPRHRFLRAA